MFFGFCLERTGFRRIYIDSNKPEWFFIEKETTKKSTESEREKRSENHGKTWN